jgi:hypothetical protein
MRIILSVLVVVGAACSAEIDRIEPTSVRDRLEQQPTSLVVSAAASGGVIAAERRASGGWTTGLAELDVEAGAIVVSAPDAATIELASLTLALGPIEIPETVLGYGLQLTDIVLELAEPARVPIVWEHADEAHGRAALPLVLTWSLTNHGDTSPLGSPDLPGVPAELVLFGDARVVHAELRLGAPGELWRWANLVRLADLTLVVIASNREG